MDSILIIVSRPEDRTFRERLDAAGFTRTSEESWSKETLEGRVYVSVNAFAEEEIGEERATFLQAKIQDTTFYTMDFSDIGACREAMKSVARGITMYVDTDYGTVFKGEQFLARITSDPLWDWRHH